MKIHPPPKPYHPGRFVEFLILVLWVLLCIVIGLTFWSFEFLYHVLTVWGGVSLAL